MIIISIVLITHKYALWNTDWNIDLSRKHNHKKILEGDLEHCWRFTQLSCTSVLYLNCATLIIRFTYIEHSNRPILFFIPHQSTIWSVELTSWFTVMCYFYYLLKLLKYADNKLNSWINSIETLLSHVSDNR